MPQAATQTPGHRIVQRLGGVKRTADYAERSVNTVYRWLEPVESGGQGGLIPLHAQRRIIKNAAPHGVALTHADFVAEAEPLDTAA